MNSPVWHPYAHLKTQTPAPKVVGGSGSYFTLESGERLRIWAAEALPEVNPGTEPGTLLGADRDGLRVACGQGVLKITRLQLPGGKPLAIDAVLTMCPCPCSIISG